MNTVISSYFDDAHRGLQRSHPASPSRAGASNNVKKSLPRLRSETSSPAMSARRTDHGGSWQQSPCAGSPNPRLSKSTGNLNFHIDNVNQGLQEQSFQQVLEENSKLVRKLRALQEQFSITSAKKEAFRMQVLKLETEFKKGREQTDVIAHELIVTKREAASCSKECSDAVKMMGEMRKAHLQEAKMLQRGLEAMRGTEKFKNRVDDTADMFDKLGRAVVQRDEAMRDKLASEATLKKVMVDLRALAEECTKLRRQNNCYEHRQRETIRKGRTATPGLMGRARAELDSSDEEFEVELMGFENRFQILEEGPMGLDILASNLSRDKRLLEKALRLEQEARRVSCTSLEEWKELSLQKDCTITEQNYQIEDMMMSQAALQEEIDRKRREVEEAVNTERAKLEQRLAELQKEAQDAREEADSVVLASDKLSQQLVKVHEEYDEASQRKRANKGEPDIGLGDTGGLDIGFREKEQCDLGMEEPAPEADSAEWKMVEMTQGHEVRTHKSERQCFLDLSLWEECQSGKLQLRAHEQGGAETSIALTDDLLKDLDSSNPWQDLFSRVGLSGDPEDPLSRVAISEFVGQEPVTLTPNGVAVLCRVHSFGTWRYFISGVSLSTSFMAEYVLAKDELMSDEDLSTALATGATGSDLISTLLGKMSFHDGSGFCFSPGSAIAVE